LNRLSSPDELESIRELIIKNRDSSKTGISVCGGTSCSALGGDDVIAAFKQEIEKQGISDKVDFRVTGCAGFCDRGPVVSIGPENIFYGQVKAENVAQIISETVLKGNIIDSLLFLDSETGKRVVHAGEIPFYKKQKRILLANNLKIAPTSISDYLALGGYAALSKALFKMSSEQVIEEVKKAELRGRGGGGFPAAVKWESCRRAQGDTKYILCNAEEGDPGAFVDRNLLESSPHGILEGMIIGAYAIGGYEGYIYIRKEYDLALKNLELAIEQAEECGLLGKDILGSGFDFSIRINIGGGAFVCGESTALMASIEGRVGEPRAKYIHTAERGLWDKPTNLNNVETWANVPLIINNGADWYSQIGSDGSKGTKIFSLAGNIKDTGLIEVPMGITLREIIYEIGGGIPGGKKFKAVQTGGPSGGCIPESLLDLRVGFEELAEVGSVMGSGSMIVMDEDTCMVDVAKYFITFLEGQSCGKCVPCREGLKRIRQILTNITEGRGKDEDIELLECLSATLIDSSLCALGSAATNSVLTTLRYFGQEYEAHIRDKRCPAGVCKELVT